MKPGRQAKSARSALTATVCLALPVLLLQGCSGIVASLRYDDRLLVKVPDIRIHEEQVDRDGWHFRHVVEAPRDRRNAGQWYVAWQDDNLRPLPPWKLVLGRWERVRRMTPSVADASQHAFGVYPSMIEPNLVFHQPAAGKKGNEPVRPENTGRPTREQQLFVGARQTPSWPSPTASPRDPAWHLGQGYSQLAAARAALVRQGKDESAIRIAILDNGFSRGHVGMPKHLEDEARGDAIGWVQGTEVKRLSPPGDWGSSHGTGTIGLLAGRPVIISERAGQPPLYRGALGGAPEATIVPVRVAPWVFSVETASLAYGIDYASRKKHCDVISLSHGGSPSQAWVDAINAAYERGTAIIAAEGDFFSLTIEPYTPRPIIVPSAPVYPAAFRRVLGVTGVTSASGSYACNSLTSLLKHPGEFMKWISRGSYGPDGWRKPFQTEATPDPAQKRLGSLRAYPIAAYSPNVPWLVSPTKEKPFPDRVDLDGSGTSAATPQVAATAALWLAAHQEELKKDWHSWKKAEAVYFALLASANRTKPAPDRYLGAGALKANNALSISYRQIQQMHDTLLAFPKGGSGRDYFDGERSLGAILGGDRSRGKWTRPCDLEQEKGAIDDRHKAFARLYYNTLLLEAWHNGRTPRPGPVQVALKNKSERLAKASDLPVLP